MIEARLERCDMVCGDVHRIAYFFLDGALSEEKSSAVSAHLETCPGCSERIQIHRRMRRFIQSRLGSLNAPERLVERIAVEVRAGGVIRS